MNTLTVVNPEAIAASKLLKALAHPERLVVMCQLIGGEKGVNELRSHSQLGQSAFSQQLAVLRRYRLVRTRKVAKQIYYSLSSAVVEQLLQVLQQHFCSDSVEDRQYVESRSVAQRRGEDAAMLESECRRARPKNARD